MIKFLVFSGTAICRLLPQLVNTYNLSQGPVTSPALSFSGNSSVATGNISFDNILKLRCDPIRYGRNLRSESCRKVFNFIPQDDRQTVFAERDSGQPHDLNLPFRATSSECLSISKLLYSTLLEHKPRLSIWHAEGGAQMMPSAMSNQSLAKAQ